VRYYLAKSLHGGSRSAGRRYGRRRAADLRRRAVFETLESRLLMAVTVTNVNDSGPGSLRQAILDANGMPGPTHNITFAIPAGPQTINLLSPLPPATTVPDVVLLDATQNVTIVSPSASALDNVGNLTKTGAGTLTISQANNLTGNIQVDGGSFRINNAVAPTLASGIAATVDGTGTLELAGSVSALAGGANGVNISNNSSAAAGLLVSGANQVVGGIDGTGTVMVNAGGGLTANHIVQNALVIAGAPGSAATVTIAASDAAGHPLGDPQPFGPVQGVDGEPLAELWPFGGMVANGNPFARSPVLFTTQAGTVLALMRYQANSQDNSGDNNIYVRRSYDNGKTFSPATIISPPPLPGDAALLASWGGTSWALTSAGPDLVQRQDGTIYLFYCQTRNGGPQIVAQRQYVYRYMTSKDDGQTWSVPTDITPATYFAGNQNVATITSVSDPNPGVVRLALTFKTNRGSLPAARALLKISGLVNDPMGLNGHSYWISAVISNKVGNVAVVELAGTPAWQDGTTIGQASIVTPQSVWLGTVGGGEPILRSNRIVIPMYYRYDAGGSGSEPFVGCVYSDDGVTFSRGMLTDETQAAVFGDGGQSSGMLEPHFTELTANNHLYISCNTKGSYHGHMTSTDGGQTWTAGLDDGTGGSTLLQVASTPAPVVALGGGEYVMVLPDDSAHRLRRSCLFSEAGAASFGRIC
jgi:autotransporter-associated beta strand protein